MNFRIYTLVIIIQALRLIRSEKCYCNSYVIFEDGLSKDYLISTDEYTIDNTSCDGDGIMACKNSCIEMFRELTDDGDTCMQIDGQTRRVADWMCKDLKRNICNARVGVFVQGCGSDPVDTGFRFKQPICCKSGRSIHC